MSEKNQDFSAERHRELLANLTSQDFLSLGMHDLAYIRPVVLQGRKAYAVHAANGAPLSISEDFTSALISISEQDMQATTLQ